MKHRRGTCVCLQTELQAEVESLRAQRDEASARVVSSLKDAKAKAEELEKERREKEALAARVAELERRNEELRKGATNASKLNSGNGESIAGLEEDVKKEFDEVRLARQSRPLTLLHR